MIVEDQIPEILKSKGLTVPDNFDVLLSLIKSQLNQQLDFPLESESFVQFERRFIGDVFLIDIFPIVEINKVSIDRECLNEGKDYYLDKANGIIEFKDNHIGFLEVEYIAGFTEEQYNTYIVPLLIDIIEYQSEDSWTKDASSVKEGDVTVNFDTSISKGALIQSKIDKLNKSFGAYCRMI